MVANNKNAATVRQPGTIDVVKNFDLYYSSDCADFLTFLYEGLKIARESRKQR